jgi:hypothetical protein
MEEIQYLKSIFKETIKDLTNYILPEYGSCLEWRQLSEKDFKILNGLWHECDNDLNYLLTIEQNNRRIDSEFMPKEDSINENDNKQEVNLNLNPFHRIQEVTKNLTLAVITVSVFLMFYLFCQIFMKSILMSRDENWIHFSYSVSVIVALILLLFDIHYCHVGRGRTEDLTRDMRLFATLLILDLAFIMRTVFVFIPSKGLTFGSLIVFMGYLSRFFLQILVLTSINVAKRETKKLKRKLTKLLGKKIFENLAKIGS